MRYTSLPVSQLSAWANLNQVEFDRIEITQQILDEHGNDKGGGLLANADIEAGTCILRVPADLVLSMRQIEQQARTDHHLRELLEAVGPSFSQNARKSTLLFLLLQLTQSSPDARGHKIGLKVPLTQYVEFLPKIIPLPTFYDAEQRNMLAGTSLESALEQKGLSLEQEFDRLRTATQNLRWCREVWWNENDGVVLTLEDWKLLDAIYRSRALDLPRGFADSMVPVLDMVNHAADDLYNARFECDENGDVLLVVRDERQIRAGEEVTIKYGCGGACEMIFSYGFLDEGARSAREIFLSFDIPQDDPLALAKIRFAKEAPGVRIFSNDKEEIKWDGALVWWACVNEEDGLGFDLAQTNTGEMELQVTWNGASLSASDELKALLAQDPRYDLFRLRANVLVQERVELQGSRLSETSDMFDDYRTRSVREKGSALVSIIGQLRGLELNLLMSAYQALETEKIRLMGSDTVRSYLAHDDDAFQADAVEHEDFS